MQVWGCSVSFLKLSQYDRNKSLAKNTEDTEDDLLLKSKQGAPKWFRFEPGFKFWWGEGTPAMVLGVGNIQTVDARLEHEAWGTHRADDIVSFSDLTLVCAYRYQGTWYTRTLEDKDGFWESVSPWTGE